jgi:vanillate O-demethylase monooxygenase subunit
MTAASPNARPSEEAIAQYYQALRPFWHPVARECDVEDDKPMAVVLLEQPLVVARLEGEIVVMDNVCRHLGAALSLGDVIGGRTIRCPYHGWEYDRTGRCVHIPLRKPEQIPSMAKVQRYEAEVRYGLVWVRLEPSDSKIPDYPQYFDDSFRKGPLTVHRDWKASMPRLVMAALDDTHFSWVHPGILGLPEQPYMPERIGEQPVTVSEDGVLNSRYRTRLPVNPMAAAGETSNETAEVEFDNYATVGSMMNVITGEEGTSVTFNVFSPVSYDLTRTFTQLARNYDTDPERDQVWEDFNLGIKEQDRVIAESQRPWMLPPLKARLILYVRPEDLPLVEYQKYLERIGVPQI